MSWPGLWRDVCGSRQWLAYERSERYTCLRGYRLCGTAALRPSRAGVPRRLCRAARPRLPAPRGGDTRARTAEAPVTPPRRPPRGEEGRHRLSCAAPVPAPPPWGGGVRSTLWHTPRPADDDSQGGLAGCRVLPLFPLTGALPLAATPGGNGGFATLPVPGGGSRSRPGLSPQAGVCLPR
jgi:hypothetical protein